MTDTVDPRLQTRATELFGVRFPIVQTGMGWVAGASLVSGTANAGGLGILAAATMTFDEMVEVKTGVEGSFRVSDEDGQRVTGLFGVQENIVSFTPGQPLAEDMTYLVEVPAGGIQDLSGNAVEETVTFRFSTGGALR